MSKIRLYDRSRVTTDWKCKRKRFWNYEYNGTGISAGTAAYELYFGTVFHDAAATIATFQLRDGSVPIDDICQTAWDQMYNELLEQLNSEEYAIEQAYLMANMIRGFYLSVWPRLLELYPEVIVVEQEIVGKDGFMVKPDLIMRSPEGTFIYIEFKTTSNKSEKWQESWAYAPQLHAYMRTINETLDVKVTAAQVVGLYKGYEKAGRQESIFCYAYHRPGNPPFVPAETSYVWKAGFKKLPIWKIEDSEQLLRWVEDMPKEILEEQFPLPPIVYLNEGVADTFFRQAQIREGEIYHALRFLKEAPEGEQQALMDMFFPQNLEACKPSFGSECPYLPICHHGMEPTNSYWQPRVPHHGPELEAYAKLDN